MCCIGMHGLTKSAGQAMLSQGAGESGPGESGRGRQSQGKGLIMMVKDSPVCCFVDSH